MRGVHDQSQTDQTARQTQECSCGFHTRAVCPKGIPTLDDRQRGRTADGRTLFADTRQEHVNYPAILSDQARRNARNQCTL
jgi:hypothetical protein